MTGRRAMRLGMLVPSSNTVAEPQTARLLPADGSVSLHVSRLRVTQISDAAASHGQFASERFADAADLLADAEVDLILWNGTAAGWLGLAHDEGLVAAIEARTGIRATTAVVAINAALGRLGARRIGLVTPYVAALEGQIAATYAEAGIEVAAAARLDLTVNTDYAAVAPETLAGMVRAVARVRPDAIVILCTNLAGAAVAGPLARDVGIPVLDSVEVAVGHGVALLRAGGRP